MFVKPKWFDYGLFTGTGAPASNTSTNTSPMNLGFDFSYLNNINWDAINAVTSTLPPANPPPPPPPPPPQPKTACEISRDFKCDAVCNNWDTDPVNALKTVETWINVAKNPATTVANQIYYSALTECHYRSANAYFRKKLKDVGFCDLKNTQYCTKEPPLPAPITACESNTTFPCTRTCYWGKEITNVANTGTFTANIEKYYSTNASTRNEARAQNECLYRNASDNRKSILLRYGSPSQHTTICAIAPSYCKETQY